jgi:hypothetical protein
MSALYWLGIWFSLSQVATVLVVFLIRGGKAQ